MSSYHTTGNGAPAQFCRTPTAVAIHEVVNLAVAYSAFGMGAVIGAAGVGKTSAFRAYAADQPGVCYCTMNPAQATMARALSRVHGALVGGSAPPRASDPYDGILEAIQSRSPRALLLDEAHHAGDGVLNAFRCLHDDTGLPIVFAGNESLYGRVTEESADAFKQLASRVGAKVVIESASEGDVRVLAEHYGVAGEAAVSWLAKRCVGVAGLRTVARLMALARASVGARHVQLDDLKTVAKGLGLEGSQQ